uniref:Uncharacterized protein n=1 Tax=Parascaris equorum TaxID=6256 RepID=A0A914S3K2_PAREQ
MKDWSAVMDWSPHSDHKGEYLQLWSNHNLDRAVAQSQSFINECRRALGLSMKFWVAEIHEIVKNTILHYSEIRIKCGELNDALMQSYVASNCYNSTKHIFPFHIIHQTDRL